MNWKEFLKPDWRKIVITVLLFLIIPEPIVLCIDPGGCNWTLIPFGNLLSPLMILLFIVSMGGSVTFEPILIILMTLLVSYFLSCLIVWIYDKVKKK